MQPDETNFQSAPATCPSSTLYSIEYHDQKIENVWHHLGNKRRDAVGTRPDIDGADR